MGESWVLKWNVERKWWINNLNKIFFKQLSNNGMVIERWTECRNESSIRQSEICDQLIQRGQIICWWNVSFYWKLTYRAISRVNVDQFLNKRYLQDKYMDCFLRFDLTIHHDFRLLLYLANNIEDKYIKSLSLSIKNLKLIYEMMILRNVKNIEMDKMEEYRSKYQDITKN